jgi:argininosuccinate lyase
VNKGVAFRDAYKEVGNEVDKGVFQYDISKGLHHTHEGSIGNLRNEEIRSMMKKVLEKFS